MIALIDVDDLAQAIDTLEEMGRANPGAVRVIDACWLIGSVPRRTCSNCASWSKPREYCDDNRHPSGPEWGCLDHTMLK